MSNLQSSIVRFRSMLSGLLHKRVGIILISAFTVITSYADVGLLFPFGDHMVLQRGSATIWGTATPGERVTLHFRDTSTVAVVNADGRWRAELNTGKAGGPFTLVAEGRNRVELEDVLVGEIWLGSGQSNMNMALKDGRGGVLNAKEEIAAANYPNIRLLQIPNGRDRHNPDYYNVWAPCTPASAKDFSAALYFFARRVHQELGIPIGVINASQGGSPIEPWLPEGALYKKCVADLIPMRIKGILWYQGETNARDDKAFLYGENLTKLVTGWRSAWGDELPFYAVQIASCFAFGANTHIVRDQTIQALRALARTGMISTFDIGELSNSHPHNKQTVGLRLGNLALREQYGRRDLLAYSPQLERMTVTGSRVKVFFEHAEGGLTTNDGKSPDWFQIAGEDRQFHWAKSHIDGSVVELWHPDVAKPVAVQFAYGTIAVPNLVGMASELPAMPFRTHEWPEAEPSVDVIHPTVIPIQASHDEWVEALAASDPLVIQVGGRVVATLQLGIQGTNLAIRAVVDDAQVTANDANWKSANIDIYTALLDDATVHQVVIPVTDAIPSALCYEMGKAQPAIDLPFANTQRSQDQGYTLTASIPLAAFSLTPEVRSFRMEASVTVSKKQGQPREWISLFGSIGAFRKSDLFRTVTY